MTREDIKKAAEEYAKEACRPIWRSGKEQVCMIDFMEGHYCPLKMDKVKN